MINNTCPNCCLWCFYSNNYQRIDHWFINLDNRINNIIKGYKSSSNNGTIVYVISIFLEIEKSEPGINEISNNCPYNKEWKCLFKCQAESGTYSKSPFLLQSVTLLNDIIPVIWKRQHILFNKFKTNFFRNVNANKTVGHLSRVGQMPILLPTQV
ncbi:hypothetical protein BCR32DRAFT_282360 [Anaeromyces robustus]|uniref:Uncharacterized protein n=1 Tax=Anaeromyces robustus TaxID=1754192 RepID=A0A1Y1WYW5_9FUNG|nr:hypothetical protein BCR32DRAFT_282360 [Anaeromyces robustus]|eukprot:ORX78376.1 hypothetical protein BCR32DRAFT_282360 [Anaeromyces robustus]